MNVFKKNNINKIIPYLILSLIGVFFCFFIILKPGFIMHGDVKLPWNMNNLVDSTRYLFSDHFGSISGLEVIGWSTNLYLIINLFAKFNLGTDILIKFIFIFTTFLSLFSFYIFSEWLSKNILKNININKYFLILVSIFFTFNPWILNQIQAWSFWLAYVFTPIIILLFFKFLETLRFKYVLLMVLIIGFISAGPQYLFYTFILLLIFLILYVLIINKKILKNPKFYVKTIIAVIVFTLTSFAWIYVVFGIFSNNLQMTTGYGVGSGDVSKNMILDFARNATIKNIFTGYDQWVSWFDLDIKLIIQKILTFIPFYIFIFYLLIYKNTNKYKQMFFLFILITTTFFATLAYGPNIPGYIDLITSKPIASTIGFVFRTTQKLSYFIFIGFSISFIFVYSDTKKIGRIVLSTTIILYFLSVPFIKALSYYWKYYIPNNEPQYYIDFYKYIDNIEPNKDSKILWLAPYSYGWGKNKLKWETSFVWNQERNANHTPETSSSLSNISWYHLTFKNWTSLYNKIDFNDNNNLNNLGKNLLSISNIKYVVYHNDIVNAEKDGNKEIENIINHSDLKLIKQFDNKIFLFQNPFVKDIIYNNTNQKIYIKKINPTLYHFSTTLKKDDYIYFAQQFDQFWMLKINNKIIKPESAYDINLTKYKINQTGEINGEIYYFPQTYYQFGLIISGTTLIGCVTYLIIDQIKNQKLHSKEYKKNLIS